MQAKDLALLDAAVVALVRQPGFAERLERLGGELRQSPEPFVWAVVEPDSLGSPLPAVIRSCWIFVLRPGVGSGCHVHPNSVQHMVMIRGQGASEVGGVRRPMPRFGAAGVTPAEAWFVIGEGVPHEFFPEGDDMVVVSFHTCAAEELEEIAWRTGASRVYGTGR
jgi:hypothetical protein